MERKKRLLFVIPSLIAGGGEKSLINLLSQIDYERFDVDLFMFNHVGLFVELLPPQVNIIDLPEDYRLFSLPLFASVWQLARTNNWLLVYSRLMFTLRNYRRGNAVVNEQYSWKYAARALQPLAAHYDVAIGYLEKTATYFCVDKVRATKKIGWVHTDYDRLGMDAQFDQPYFAKLDHIVTVSERCAHILKERFPQEQDKVHVIYNVVSPALIHHMAIHEAPDVYERQEGETIICSIGRLQEHKNFALAIEACALLVAKGHRLRWYIIGEGEERAMLTQLIAANKLEDHVFLIGLQANPYPYIEQADLYVQTSRIEGKSIAIDEAKILQKPIVVTDFNTVKDQIDDGRNGLIVAMDAASVAAGIEKLIKEPRLKRALSAQLAAEQLGTEREIHKLYALVGDAT